MEDISDLIVGFMTAIFGLIGLFLVAGATDAEMSIFGSSLAVFALFFDFNLLKKYFDRRNAARLAAIVHAEPANV